MLIVEELLLAAALPAIQASDDAAKRLLGAMDAFPHAARKEARRESSTIRKLDQQFAWR